MHGGRDTIPLRIAIFWNICISLVTQSRSKLKIYFYCTWVGHILAPIHCAMQYCLCRVGGSVQLLHLAEHRSTSDKTHDPHCQIFLYILLLWCDNRWLHTFYATDFSSICACQVSKKGGRTIIALPISILWVHFLRKWILSSSFFPSLWNRSVISGKVSREVKEIQVCQIAVVVVTYSHAPVPHSLAFWSINMCSCSCAFPILGTLSMPLH